MASRELIWVRTTNVLGMGTESAKIKFAFFKEHNAKLQLCFPLGLLHLKVGVGETVQRQLDDPARLSP